MSFILSLFLKSCIMQTPPTKDYLLSISVSTVNNNFVFRAESKRLFLNMG